MNQADYFFGYFFEPTITLPEDVFFSLWAYNFSKELKRLHEELVIENEDGSFDDFQKMNYMDFAILTYQERHDLVGQSLN